ncbi:hypothetical protein HK098_004217 [Nowakowskiella sp. JEL0407]|nr:hypothetical protein HK098_004217 [Nowakowskiella sp. JEL0407]
MEDTELQFLLDTFMERSFFSEKEFQPHESFPIIQPALSSDSNSLPYNPTETDDSIVEGILSSYFNIEGTHQTFPHHQSPPLKQTVPSHHLPDPPQKQPHQIAKKKLIHKLSSLSIPPSSPKIDLKQHLISKSKVSTAFTGSSSSSSSTQCNTSSSSSQSHTLSTLTFQIHPISCNWPPCDRTFDDNTALYDHLVKDHIGRKSMKNLCLKCNWKDCGVSFNKRDHIISHIKKHVELKKHVCCGCERSYKHLQDLKKHTKKCAAYEKKMIMEKHKLQEEKQNDLKYHQMLHHHQHTPPSPYPSKYAIGRYIAVRQFTGTSEMELSVLVDDPIEVAVWFDDSYGLAINMRSGEQGLISIGFLMRDEKYDEKVSNGMSIDQLIAQVAATLTGNTQGGEMNHDETWDLLSDIKHSLSQGSLDSDSLFDISDEDKGKHVRRSVSMDDSLVVKNLLDFISDNDVDMLSYTEKESSDLEISNQQQPSSSHAASASVAVFAPPPYYLAQQSTIPAQPQTSTSFSPPPPSAYELYAPPAYDENAAALMQPNLPAYQSVAPVIAGCEIEPPPYQPASQQSHQPLQTFATSESDGNARNGVVAARPVSMKAGSRRRETGKGSGNNSNITEPINPQNLSLISSGSGAPPTSPSPTTQLIYNPRHNSLSLLKPHELICEIDAIDPHRITIPLRIQIFPTKFRVLQLRSSPFLKGAVVAECLNRCACILDFPGQKGKQKVDVEDVENVQILGPPFECGCRSNGNEGNGGKKEYGDIKSVKEHQRVTKCGGKEMGVLFDFVVFGRGRKKMLFDAVLSGGGVKYSQVDDFGRI